MFYPQKDLFTNHLRELNSFFLFDEIGSIERLIKNSLSTEKNILLQELFKQNLLSCLNENQIPKFSWHKLELIANELNIDIKHMYNLAQNNINFPGKFEINYPEIYSFINAKLNSFQNHDTLIRCGQKLGYALSDKGICHGYTMRWIEASILNQQSKFLNRIYKINELYKLLNNVTTLEELKNLDEWKDLLWDIKAFYESLYLYQYVSSVNSIFGKYVNQNDVDIKSEIAACDDINRIGGIKITSPLHYGEFTADYLLNIFKNFEDLIGHNYNQPVVFLMHCGNMKFRHSISVTYNPTEKSWHWMDININKLNSPSKLLGLTGTINSNLYNKFDYFCIYAVLPKKDFKILEPSLSTITKFESNNEKIKLYILTLSSRSGDLSLVQEVLKNIKLGEEQIVSEALIIAAQKGHLEVVKELLKNYLNANNISAKAISVATKNGHLEIVRELLKKGVNPNIFTKDVLPPLFIASENGDLNIVLELLTNGANPNIISIYQATPLYIASQKGHTKIVIELLKNYSDPNIPTIHGTTPLFIAAEKGYADIVKELLKNKANLNAVTNFGYTPLFIATQNDNLEIVKELLENGANPNITAFNGATAFFIAALMGNFTIVKYLLTYKELDITKPLRESKDYLERMAQKYDYAFERMRAHIDQYSQGSQDLDLKNIEVSPKQIAIIMGHNKIVELINAQKIFNGSKVTMFKEQSQENREYSSRAYGYIYN